MWSLKRVVTRLLFLIIISLHFLSSTTLSDNPQAQQKCDKINDHLPGQSFSVSFSQYSGYVTVDEQSGKNLFYWLQESDEDASSKPLVLWLNGGPGCSSIGYGEAEEIGAFHIQADGHTLYLNSYAWNQVANILFLDSPVGVGYSYSKTLSDVLNNGDKRTAEDSLAFLLKWLERFPQYKGRDFYITGESYAGHYVPQLSQAIVRHNSATHDTSINLKGYMVGNAMMDNRYDDLGSFQFYWTMGMISDLTYRKMKRSCLIDSGDNTSAKCMKILDAASLETGYINTYSIFMPTCSSEDSSKQVMDRVRYDYNPCTLIYSNQYFNSPDVREALHVHPDAAHPWSACNEKVQKSYNRSDSVLDVYRELIQSGLRIWIYSGDTDGSMTITGTRYSIKALKLKTDGLWRPWAVGGQVAGWMQKYKGLMFVTVKGSGHEVPKEKPKEALVLFKAFLSGKSP